MSNLGRIQQMQMTFAPEEDRMLFRLNFGDRARAEFRFWMTRRYVKLLWQALLNLLKANLPKEAVEKLPDAPSQAGALEVEHKQAVAQADFQTTYQESQIFPLGEAPILLVRVAVKAVAEGGHLLCLHPREGQGVEIKLDAKMLHSLCKLVADSAEKAEWDLQLDFGKAQQLLEQGGLN